MYAQLSERVPNYNVLWQRENSSNRSDGSVEERSPPERKVVGSIPDRVIPKTF